MTCFLAIFLNWSLSSLHSLAASTFAGLKNYIIIDFISYRSYIIDVLPYSLNNVYFIPVYIGLGNHAHYRKQNLLYTLNRWPERIWIDVWVISKYLQISLEFHMKNILHINLSYHRSELVSYPNGSAPGGCKIEMQTRPSG